MRSFRFEREQIVPRPLAEVFTFFSDPSNLERITPPWLHFRILRLPAKMQSGVLIEYKLRVRGLPLRWVTRIESFEPPHRFTDIQLRGPYRLWHHTHEFRQTPQGTTMRDVVEYALALPVGASIANRLFVAPDLARIFDYRRKAIDEVFGAKT